MLLLERLAEEKILQAMERGEFDNLPGTGRPLPAEDDMAFVPPDMRVAYRILKNAGFIPEEVRLRREIGDVQSLLQACGDTSELSRKARARLSLLIQGLGELSGSNLAVQDKYYRQLTKKFGAP